MSEIKKPIVVDKITFVNPTLGTKYSVSRIANGSIFFKGIFFWSVLEWVEYIREMENPIKPPYPPTSLNIPDKIQIKLPYPPTSLNIPDKIQIRRSKSFNNILTQT
jgi:hypothetical protein